MTDPDWRPDFGPHRFVEKAGATAIGARPFLIAWNVCLDTQDVPSAKAIAARLRTSGGRRQDGGRAPGRFEGLQGDGWLMPEQAGAQVTFNVTDFRKAPLHAVYEACQEEAKALGTRVTGSELVGLAPLEALRACGRHYAGEAANDEALVAAAVSGLGLGARGPFRAEERVFEWVYERSRDGGKQPQMDTDKHR
jgi:glutamate formiminotransferase/formiminotetrahydrofolate cyclodeaminase